MERIDFQRTIHLTEEVPLLAHIGTLDFYPRTSLLHLDSRGRELLGFSDERKLSYDCVLGAIHPDDAERVHETIESTLRGEGNGRCALECRLSGTAETGLRWASLQGRAYFDPAGNCERFVSTLSEVTQKKQTEEELRSAIQARDEFLSIASHELKPPLTSLSLQLQMLHRSVQLGDKGLTTEKLEKSLALCERQSRRLADLLDELLDLTRIRLGRLRLVYEEVNLSQLASEMLEQIKAEFNEGERIVTIDAAPEAVGLWDRSRIEQVAINLFSNAFKYGEGRPIQISVRKNTETQKLYLEVRDQGMGIAPQLQEKIFERFERAIGFANISGLGLGLYITRQIVEAHGGTIHVQSSPGQGSTFTVELPKYPHHSN
jgi:PAS domain S-box-containing protein